MGLPTIGQTGEWWVRDPGGEEPGQLFKLTKKRPSDKEEKWQHIPGDDEQDDLVQMLNADEPNVLSALRKRHVAGHPYTRVGVRGVLISVNPYQTVDVYGTDLMYEYYKSSDSVQTSMLKPHIFAVASEAVCRTGRTMTVSPHLFTGNQATPICLCSLAARLTLAVHGG